MGVVLGSEFELVMTAGKTGELGSIIIGNNTKVIFIKLYTCCPLHT